MESAPRIHLRAISTGPAPIRPGYLSIPEISSSLLREVEYLLPDSLNAYPYNIRYVTSKETCELYY